MDSHFGKHDWCPYSTELIMYTAINLYIEQTFFHFPQPERNLTYKSFKGWQLKCMNNTISPVCMNKYRSASYVTTCGIFWSKLVHHIGIRCCEIFNWKTSKHMQDIDEIPWTVCAPNSGEPYYWAITPSYVWSLLFDLNEKHSDTGHQAVWLRV